jgi:hypothetical protein
MINNQNRKILLIIFGLFLVIISIQYIYYRYNRRMSEGMTNKGSDSDTPGCDTMEALYPNGRKSCINSVNVENENFQYPLLNYYIQTAYNACNTGPYQDGYVSLCALKEILRQGVRGLDFAIYSIDDLPVVSSSTTDNYHIKGTYNTVPFLDVMKTLVYYAFAGEMVPNPNDPIIIHLRFKSTNQTMYGNLVNIFKQFNDYLLGPKYSYEMNGNNLGNSLLKEFMKKIVIIADKSNDTFADTEVDEYVNMTSNSVFMRELTDYDVKNTPDLQELQTYNKRAMSFVTPDKGIADPSNPSGIIGRESGCQMIAMKYQTKDVHLEDTIDFFCTNGSSFVLKPEHLRDIPTVIPDPTPQNPTLSFATRTNSTVIPGLAIQT